MCFVICYRADDSTLSVCKTTNTSTLERTENEMTNINIQQDNMEIVHPQ